MNARSFLSELKRRRVYSVAVAYVVVAWLLIQVATQVFPFFEIPNWAVRLVIVLLALGFPVALILAWAFELTPEGIKRTDELTPEESIKSRRARKLIAFTAVAAVIAAGLFVFQWMKSHSILAPRQSDATAQPDGLTGVRSSISDKSIAVLPFENLSSDQENAYFAAGIQDEILTRLAKIGALKVISRSSTLQFQARPRSLREIAQQLGVANILEGSVQKAGNAVHVNVQLIKAATDEHLWAESYDRTLENIFGVEGEIAQMVAEALHAKLTGTEARVLAQKPTSNPAAYDAYLRGSAQSRQEGEEAARAAQVSFADAVRLDPQFAAAWAALSRIDSLLFFVYDSTPSRRAEAEKALAEAFRLQPDLAETQLARAYLQYWVRRDYAGALELMRQLRTSWPNNAEALEAMALISARLGQWKQGVDYIQQAMALNPKDFSTRLEALELALAVRDFALALRLADEGLRNWPGNSALLGTKAFAFQARGQLDEAQSVLAGVKLDPATSDAGSIALTYQVSLRRDPAVALKLLDSYPRAAEEGDPKFLPYWAVVLKVAGRNDDARAIFTRVRDMVAPLVKTQPENAGFLGILAFTQAELDQRDDVSKTLDQFAAASLGDARSGALGDELRARVFAHFGDKDRAVTSLERLLSAPADGLFGVPVTSAILRLDPMFDSLRGDPRFEKLATGKP